MATDAIKTTETIVSCSDNGQHPLVYINLESGSGTCQYCGQRFVRVAGAESRREAKSEEKAAA